MLARILAVCLIVTLPAAAQKPKKPRPRPKRLVAVVKKTNKMLSLVADPGRKRVDDSGLFNGVLRFSVVIDRIVEDDAVTIDAKLTVDRGPMYRYKTREERLAIVQLSDEVKMLKKLLARGVSIHESEFRFQKQRRERPSREDIAHLRRQFDKKIAEDKRVFGKKIGEAEADLRDFVSPINERIEAEKAKYDAVSVTITIPRAITEELDFAKVREGSKARFVGRIKSYEIEHEPPAAGGKMRVSRLSVTATGIHKSIRK